MGCDLGDGIGGGIDGGLGGGICAVALASKPSRTATPTAKRNRPEDTSSPTPQELRTTAKFQLVRTDQRKVAYLSDPPKLDSSWHSKRGRAFIGSGGAMLISWTAITYSRTYSLVPRLLTAGTVQLVQW